MSGALHDPLRSGAGRDPGEPYTPLLDLTGPPLPRQALGALARQLRRSRDALLRAAAPPVRRGGREPRVPKLATAEQVQAACARAQALGRAQGLGEALRDLEELLR